MSATALPIFLGGVFTAGLGVIGLFFLHFWRQARDGLFGAFAVAFWLMALEQAARALLRQISEVEGQLYLLRLAAFSLILFAIVRKNMASRD
jgi:hypothetical protein